jgi:hypothetical protein
MSLRRPPTEEEIAQRAWEIYQQRGRGDEDAPRALRDARIELESAEAAAEKQDAELHPEPITEPTVEGVVIIGPGEPPKS